MTSATLDGQGRGHATGVLHRRLRVRARQSASLLNAKLELTTRCNLRCIHCYVADHQRGELPVERWLALVDELAEVGCITATLTGGEVSLKRRWLEIAERIKRSRMLLSVLTNGSALGDDEVRHLVDLRPKVVAVSLYGATADRHDAVTGVAGSFERTLAAVRTLRAGGVRCRVGSVIMKQTIDHFGAIAELAESLDCTFFFDPTVSPCDDGSRHVVDHRVDATELKGFYLSRVIRDRSLAGRLAQMAASPAGRGVGNCDAGMTSAFIDARGEIFPCMGFEPSFGNIAEQRLSDVWHGPLAAKHRAMMELPLETCASCDIGSFCTTRCPRLAAVEDGDPSGPCTRACEIARLTVEMQHEFQSETTVPAISEER